jgi:hypothetical protein
VVAWAIRPGLTRLALPGWLQERLFIQVNCAELDAALDAQDRPQTERLFALIDEWGLRTWVWEARHIDEDQG